MRLLVILLLAVVVQTDLPVSARFEVSSGSPLVGEPVDLTLRMAAPADVIIVEWPRFPDEWPPFEVMQVDDLVIEEQDNQTLYSQRMRVVIWEPGDYQSPETVVLYRVEGQDENLEVLVEPVFLSVPSVLDSDDTELRPLKAQIVLPYISPLVVFGGVSLVLVMVGAGIWSVRKRYLAPGPVRVPQETTLESAALADIQRLGTDLINPEMVFMRVSDRLRQYMGDRYSFPAQDMTSDEIINTIHAQNAEHQPAVLARLLYEADMVKFARQTPTRRHAEQYVRAAAQWVQAAAPEREA